MTEIKTKLELALIGKYFDSYPEKSISILEELSAQDIINTIQYFSTKDITRIISQMRTDKASDTLIALPEDIFRDVYSLLDPMRAAQLIARNQSNEKEIRLALLTESERKDIEELAAFPTACAGNFMDQSVETYRAFDSVKKVIASLRKNKTDHREIFVVDLNGLLIGYIPVRKLLFCDEEASVESIMHNNPPSVNALAPRDEVIEAFETFKTTALPVTHIDGSLLGAIRYASLVQEVQNQAISAMASLGGASPSEMALSAPFFSVRKRLPWLLINLLTAFIASAVVGFYEDTIAKVTALAVLLPVVAGQSGNTGAQAMAVTMRGLALREVRVRQWLKMIFKELRVGFINGLVIAIVTGAAVYFWSKSLPLGLVMMAAMTISMIVASMAGAAIPIILTSLGKDPAQSSSVVLTTVTDVMGFISFLGLATLFISLLGGT